MIPDYLWRLWGRIERGGPDEAELARLWYPSSSLVPEADRWGNVKPEEQGESQAIGIEDARMVAKMRLAMCCAPHEYADVLTRVYVRRQSRSDVMTAMSIGSAHLYYRMLHRAEGWVEGRVSA